MKRYHIIRIDEGTFAVCNRKMRTPLSEITSTGEIEQSLRLN